MKAHSKIRGCLLGGALGDSFGNALEFLSLEQILVAYGPEGLREPSQVPGLFLITDDTQMTLFGAEGLIEGLEQDRDLLESVGEAYRRWLDTQGFGGEPAEHGLASIPGLRQARAPGHTCLSALASTERHSRTKPANDSKGCGGVMRAAPAGLIGHDDPFVLGAEMAALTHGHPTGYLAAGAFSLIVAGLLEEKSFTEAAETALERLEAEEESDETARAIDAALELPPSSRPEDLGEGWIAEEALAIGLAGAIRARDFVAGVRWSANHSGDSDSTASITGQLLGAAWGEIGLPETWIGQLELRGVIEGVADELARVSSFD